MLAEAVEVVVARVAVKTHSQNSDMWLIEIRFGEADSVEKGLCTEMGDILCDSRGVLVEWVCWPCLRDLVAAASLMLSWSWARNATDIFTLISGICG